MRRLALAIALVVGLIVPAFAQEAEIEAVNAKWIDFFNKGDFAGVASLYTDDATAFPPGSGMVKGRVAIEAMWKSMAAQVSDPKLTTLDVKPLGPSADHPTFQQGPSSRRPASPLDGQSPDVCRRSAPLNPASHHLTTRDD